MSNDRESRRSHDRAAQEDMLKAQLAGVMRLAPRQACVNAAVALLLGAMLGPVVPIGWLTLWIGLHLLLSIGACVRWSRRQASRPQTHRQQLRRLQLWVLACGLTWGVAAAFLPILPSAQQLALVIAAATLSAGAAATLAAAPYAPTLFILSSLGPMTLYFVVQVELLSLGVAALALVMIGVMLASSRLVHGDMLDAWRARQAQAEPRDPLRPERREWLDVTETAAAFALFDADDRLLLWNDNYRRVFDLEPRRLRRGLTRMEVLRSCAPAIEVGQAPMARDHWVEAQRRLPEHPDVPLTQRLVSGLWLQSSIRVTAQGNLFTMHHDITERKEAEEEHERLRAQLHQAQKMEALGAFAGGIAHEFNNVLGIILGFVDLARYDVPRLSRVSQSLDEIQSAGRRAAAFVQQILAFSRHGDSEREPEPFRVVVDAAFQLAQTSLPDTIDVRCDMSDDVDMVWANAAQLQQVIMHLCDNAQDAMRDTGGVLTLSLERVDIATIEQAGAPTLPPGSYVCLTISDTGPGIAPEVIDHIFEPFFTTKEGGEGAGMGLAIAHGIITNHGGIIDVESAPGAGAAFRIYLPRYVDLDPMPSSEAPSTRPLGRGRILFVDDEAALVRVAERMLERLGYDYQAVASSREALELFQAAPHAFDLAITDMNMPDLTGEALSRELRRLRPDIPIIMCTGFSHLMDAARAQAMGIDAFLLKPLAFTDLDLAIRQVYNARRGQNQL